MKKIIALIGCALLCISLCSCNNSLVNTIKGYLGQSTEEKPSGYIETRQNELYEYDVFKKHVTLISYLGSEADVVIPTELDGKPVKIIGNSCFYGNTSIETVTVPEGIETIENAAFYYCPSLRRAKLPESCTFFGEKLFSWCTSLETVTLPESMTVIPDYAFNNCPALYEVVWNTTVTRIGVRAFSWCTSLTDITVPESVTEIADYAFYCCGTLQSVKLPQNAVYAETAFEGCDSVVISGGATENTTETSEVSETPESSEVSETVSE